MLSKTEIEAGYKIIPHFANFQNAFISVDITNDNLSKNIAEYGEVEQKGPLYMCLYKQKQLAAYACAITDYGEFICITDCKSVLENVDVKEKIRHQQLVIEAIRHFPKLKCIKIHKWFALNNNAQSIFKSLGFIDTANPGVMIFTKNTSSDVQTSAFPLPEEKKEIEIKIEDNAFKDKAAALTLLRRTDWAAEYSDNYFDTLVNHSRCYGLYKENKLIGFVRLVTDYISFASLWDMVIAEPYRNHKYSHCLVKALFEDSNINKVDTWIFLTSNPVIYSMSKKFGFESKQCPYLLRQPHATDQYVFHHLPHCIGNDKVADKVYKGISIVSDIKNRF
jgi:predicted GNAT family N-acyltransferase